MYELEKENQVNHLAKILAKSLKVNKYDDKEYKESWTLAHSFNDIEESIKKILNELLPKLRSIEIQETQINDLLLDIGEEFRHIIYHIKDPKFFKYLFDSD
jgi:hypothetical protein